MNVSFPVLLATAAWGAANGVDLLAVVLLTVGAVVGGFRGLTGELARIGGFVVAVLAGYASAALWAKLGARWAPAEGQAVVRGLISVVGVVVSATVAGQLVRRLLERLLRLLLDQPADAVFGLLVGALRSALLIVALLFLASFMAYGDFGKVLFEDSLAGRVAHPAVLWAREQIGGIDRFVPGAPVPRTPPAPVPADNI
jgi:uncharacterized membrane protein required for colicin V production